MKIKLLIFIMVLSLAINAAVLGAVGYHYYYRSKFLISPQPSSQPCPVSPQDHYLYERLGLSSQQLARMEPLAQNFHSRLEKLAGSMEGKKEDLVDLLSRKDVNPEKIAELRREMAGIQDEIQKVVIEHIMEMKKVLNIEQQRHFFDLMRRSMRSNNSWFVQERP
jgi:Spy/CpxP family protein refolding chaperone